MELVIALIGAAVVLAALVLLAAYRSRGSSPHNAESGDAGSRDTHGAPSSNAWAFGGGGLS
jgi:hypothetical protein